MTRSRKLTSHVYHTGTRSLCGTCFRPVEAAVRSRDGGVWFRRLCPDHGADEVLVSRDAAWYLEVLAYPGVLEVPDVARPVERGCPRDCGPCAAHLQVWRLVVPRTSPGQAPQPDCLVTVRDANRETLSRRLAALASESSRCDALQVELRPADGTLDVPEVVGAIVEASGDTLRRGDFLPSPVAHPHCVAVCPVARVDGVLVPVARLLPPRAIFEALAHGDGLSLGPGGLRQLAAALRRTDAVDGRGGHHATLARDAILATDALEDDGERRLAGRRLSATVVAHALMDPTLFDTGRATRCPFGVGDTPLSTAPACVPDEWRPPPAGPAVLGEPT